jgi:type 1 fimbria pilin
MILNVTDNTVTLLNTTSNETISIRSLAADSENMITNETKSSINITENAENSTTDLNLTDKFKELQGE